MAKDLQVKEETQLINIDGQGYKKQAFLIEESHPAVGRYIIVGDNKFTILDEEVLGDKKSGTFIRPFNQNDQDAMDEYDEAIEKLSEKLVSKVDIKRLIKENIKHQTLQELKTGLFILKKEESGEEIEEEHHRGCYHFKLYYKNQCFEFASGDNVRVD